MDVGLFAPTSTPPARPAMLAPLGRVARLGQGWYAFGIALDPFRERLTALDRLGRVDDAVRD